MPNQLTLFALCRRYAPLALISFLTVYLELMVIRWLAAEVRVFAYFKNFPLLAAFLGFGIGCILAQQGRNYFRFAPFLLFILVAVICFAPSCGYTHITFIDPYEHYLLGDFTFKRPLVQMLKGTGAVLGIFILSLALFVSLGEKLGQCFDDHSPLAAYTINVAFSLVGVLVFAWLCWVESGPTVWVLVASLAMLPFWRKPWQGLPMVGAALLPWMLSPASVIWSPYYRLDVTRASLTEEDQTGMKYPIGFDIVLNHDAMQGAYNHSEEFVRALPPEVRDNLLDYYNVAYRIFGPRFKKIMVLGAGAGNDVATALRNGVQAVEAVEIDPSIVRVGRQYHPEKPYASDKVRIHIGDARAFLRNPENSGYDMIVFAALDSHTVFSSMSSLRLDNYVYTVESFKEALQRLAPHGILAVTFYWYKDWQMERVFNALWRANGEKPVAVHSLGTRRNNLVLLAGPGANRNKLMNHPYVMQQNAENMVGDGTVEPTSDDWPFLYLRTRGFPSSYFSMLILILGFSCLAVMHAAQLSSSRFDWVMFLLGAGFMLLETKVLAKSALLVGATWIVNTFVIGAVLAMILAANFVVAKGWMSSRGWCFAALFASILSDWYFQFSSRVLVSSPVLNLYLVLFLLALPVFFAGILFADFFKRAHVSAAALGYNLLGATVGGVLEYSSMAWGINNLNLLCLAAYTGVAFFATSPRAARRDLA